jgi:hypothetical protein
LSTGEHPGESRGWVDGHGGRVDAEKWSQIPVVVKRLRHET